MVIIWIVKYVDYSILSTLFGVSSFVVSTLISNFLPILAVHFRQYIPNKIQTKSSSILSRRIVAVIDSTLHATNKNPTNQHLGYSEHYKRHGMLTTLLVDFDGYIVAFVTNIKARQHDSMLSYFSPLFPKILGKNYALGDPGYAGVPYVISGLKSNQIYSVADKKFDLITRNEQISIEHVNGFLKNCKTLSKRNAFIHSPELQIGCVFVVSGWYNWMKKTFGKF